jgi:cellulose synthase/poly-beta-1,6-N-acetylglucosamine synthase-like glycosyltransferase
VEYEAGHRCGYGTVPGSVPAAMNTLRISCIIPAFNSERFLAEAIARVLAQTLPVYKIIVVGAHPRMPA